MKKILRNIKNALLGKNNYEIKSLISNFLPPNPVIIEAGAHIGTDTIEMLKVWPRATIHSFEPVPHLYEKLCDNTRGKKNIFTYPIALGAESGTKDIFISSGDSDGSSSLLQPKEHIGDHPKVFFKKTLPINTLSLDDWAFQNSVTQVDFAWLDMQGYEFPVLKASKTVFKSIKVIYTEVSLKEMYEGVTLYPEFKEWMSSNGFRVELEDMPYSDFGNVLFVKN